MKTYRNRVSYKNSSRKSRENPLAPVVKTKECMLFDREYLNSCKNHPDFFISIEKLANDDAYKCYEKIEDVFFILEGETKYFKKNIIRSLGADYNERISLFYGLENRHLSNILVKDGLLLLFFSSPGSKGSWFKPKLRFLYDSKVGWSDIVYKDNVLFFALSKEVVL